MENDGGTVAGAVMAAATVLGGTCFRSSGDYIGRATARSRRSENGSWVGFWVRPIVQLFRMDPMSTVVSTRHHLFNFFLKVARSTGPSCKDFGRPC